ncbi:tRNA dihydrouridine synthase DusB [Rhodovibrio sodomensis]|uniref:tRNA-dihydrouridine synthase n=1 Tax=Rhodovibrio sodomensis TaxID=1088 RepID=A0ABS1DFB5_9PROT|nr:tRNA dihydrouridine synthase DusB [Rhodovibrio sodomensis]MBK1668923.1 tRNA dihydrouridine synthase DusB [Rhodovibrio sodomensis]
MGMNVGAIELGGVRLDTPVILAPMSGVTDKPFRRLVGRLGAGLLVSEMIASEASVRAARRAMRARKLQEDYGDEGPMAVQLAGCDPDTMAEAARIQRDRGAAIVDINFGCPVKKIVTKYAGSALMREEALAGRILERVVEAVHPLPVTLKMRLGWDRDSLNAPAFARMAQDAGIRLITVHGRTRQQLYNGTADWAEVAATKQATDLPVIVNGDIDTAADVRGALAASGADGVMIGRAACGAPWRLGQVMQLLQTGRMGAAPALARQAEIALTHYDALLSYYGSHRGVRIARKHMAWYASGLPGAAAFKRAVMAAERPDAAKALVRQLYADAQDAGSATARPRAA